MTQSLYKEICQSPAVFHRAVLEMTGLALPEDSQFKLRLREITGREPIEKSPLHDGYRGADQFEIDLTKEEVEVEEITGQLLSLEAEVVLWDDEATPHHIYPAFIVDIWSDYEEFMAKQFASGDVAARQAKLATCSREQLRADFDSLMNQRRNEAPIEGDELPTDLA